MLNWANRFNICSFMDTHNYRHTEHSYECLCAAEAIETFSFVSENTNDWLFGHNNFEAGYVSHGIDNAHHSASFNKSVFFVPATVLYIQKETLHIETIHDPRIIHEEIKATNTNSFSKTIHVDALLHKEEYMSIIEKLKAHILRGDCYEINFCQEFAGTGELDPVNVYQKLVALSPTPFSCYYKIGHDHLLCASPERFFKKENNRLISEPIKGTRKRNLNDAVADEHLKAELQESEKDKAENVMVVDLVRNDMSKLCKEGSVTVTELFHIYSFPQVHQMISKIEGDLKEDISVKMIMQHLFPMGSMTGAPKKRVLELINEFEVSARGIYSGTVGYVDPNGNADFNVVIRSIVYNSEHKKASYHVGGGITFYSDAESEYEECLLKAAAMKRVLESA